MLFPLLEFLEEKKIYNVAHVSQARLDLLKPTNMVDYAMDIYKSLHNTEECPDDMEARREEVCQKMERLKEETMPLIGKMEEYLLTEEIMEVALEGAGGAGAERLSPAFVGLLFQKLVERMQSEDRLTPQAFQAACGLSEDLLESLYHLSKFQYDCGDYELARAMLMLYLSITQNTQTERGFNALWGKFACEILNENWEAAVQEMMNLKQAIEDKPGSTALQQLQQRSWLLHWSLFVFFTHPQGRDMIIRLFFEEKYLQAIQTNCPWLLRYLTTAIIVNKRGQDVLKDLVKVIQQEDHSYSDPVTRFLECLLVNFDFDGAQAQLHQCETVLVSDFFLCSVAQEFMEEARLFIFETYCRIHRKIDLNMLAQRLALNQPEAAEKWIVDLIRGALLDAKLSSEDNTVVMGGTTPSIHQQVIERTKDLVTRSYLLSNNLEKMLVEEQNDVGQGHAVMGGYDQGGGRGRY